MVSMASCEGSTTRCILILDLSLSSSLVSTGFLTKSPPPLQLLRTYMCKKYIHKHFVPQKNEFGFQSIITDIALCFFPPCKRVQIWFNSPMTYPVLVWCVRLSLLSVWAVRISLQTSAASVQLCLLPQLPTISSSSSPPHSTRLSNQNSLRNSRHKSTFQACFTLAGLGGRESSLPQLQSTKHTSVE